MKKEQRMKRFLSDQTQKSCQCKDFCAELSTSSLFGGGAI